MDIVEQIERIRKGKVRLLGELDEVQKNSIYNMIDTAIANKRLKEALSNAMSITI